MKTKAIINWSSGKDSALTLYKLQREPNVEIASLLTTVSEEFRRVSMHGVREALLDAQALSLDLPLEKVFLPSAPSMESYEASMGETLRSMLAKGVTHSAFGDILLEDLRAYRERQLAELGMQSIFPLWGQPTDRLAREFIELGFKAVITCVNGRVLPKHFLGREIDRAFLADLPRDVDPCGENGEYHSFVYDGPCFREPVGFSVGEMTYREYRPATQSEGKNCFRDDDREPPKVDRGFWFLDLLPA